MKKKLRSLLCLTLVLVMVLGLAACGKQNGKDNKEDHPDMVYVADSLTLNTPNLSDGIRPAAYTSDGFYGLSYGKIGEREIPEGVVPEYEGQFDIYGYRLFFVGMDGSVKELKGYAPMEGKENPDGLTDFSSGANLNSLYVLDNGQLLAVENIYTNWFDGSPEELAHPTNDVWDRYRNINEYYLRTLDTDGTELSCVKLDFDTEDTWLDFYSACLDNDGNLLVIGDQVIYAFAPDGSVAYQVRCDQWPSGLFRMRDGAVAMLGWNDKGTALYPVDGQKKALGEPIQLPDGAYNLMAGDDNFDIYYVNGMYLYGYKFDSEEEVKVLNWLDVDINGESISGLRVNADGSIVGVLNRWSEDKAETEIVTLRQVPYDSVPHKEVLTLGVLYAYDIYDKVIDFNRHNDKVRIQIIDYSEFIDYENEDYDAGRTKLLTEIMSGDMPDIIMLSQLPYTQLAAKGLLEDLYPYIDKDPELKREDFFPNLLDALEVNGGLYQVVPYFNVQTLIGATSVVGDKPGWTYRDLQAALATMPQGCDPLDMYTTRGDLLRTLIWTDMAHFVDWTTGECYFDSKDFIELLEFTAQFPESIPDNMEWEDTGTRIAQGRQMLTTASLYSVDSMVWNDVQFGEQGCTYIGYPTNNGVGSFMTIDAGYGISVNCKNKDAAWEFLRSFLTAEEQSRMWGGIPARLDVYQKQLDDAMLAEYEKDENGNFKLDENGERIQIPRGSYMMEDGTEHYIYAMTQEQADKLWEAVTTCNKIVDYDTSIVDIVLEQAQAYYAGQKSAEEVARLIQNKVKIYINEQR